MAWREALWIAVICVIRVQSELTESISTQLGPVQGIRNPDADEFLGIPFGNFTQRFAPIRNPRPWSDTFQAVTPAPGCYQDCTAFPSACPAAVSEQCFTLNLYRPRQTPSNARLPVMVHFHGGAYTSGAAGVQLLNASHLVGVTGGVIVIACNYRLHAFGFWFAPDIPDSSTPGNVALLDQEKCLEWIRDNVAAFGGDPTNVTMWGQSAGASSIGFHLQRQILQNDRPLLFHRAIFQSWPAGIQPRSKYQAQVFNRDFAKLAGCLLPLTLTSCLRGKSADDILQASKLTQFDFTSYPDKLITIGLPWEAALGLTAFPLLYNNIEFINRYASQITIPIIWGTNRDEGTEFIYQAFPDSFAVVYPEALVVIGLLWRPENVVKITQLYNITFISNTTDYRPVLSQLLNDYAFACPLRNMSRALTTAHRSDVYTYLFDYILKANGTLYGTSHWAPECYDRVCHKSEMPFVFNPAGVPTILFTEEEQTFARLINRFWTNFGKAGNPNNPSSVSPTWNVFSFSSSTTLHLTLPETTTGVIYPDDRYCDFWDNLGYIF